ncbi:MAG TPA: hypothetical protein VN764_06090 [Polyangiaceae bacterium]|nr:hypothetical protein [Polyangiaceae bacterium]
MRNRLRLGSALVLIAAPLGLAACNDTETDYDSVSHVTRVTIDPDEFVGEVVCSLSGGFTYQATLYDVTEGLERAFELPSSSVVSCAAKVNFERVVAGHRYVATIVGFDRDDVRVQNPGSTLVVDEDGQLVQPRWSTTCWGTDKSRDRYGEGGAGPTPDGEGGDGSAEDLGVIAYLRTEMVMRGCDPLTSP